MSERERLPVTWIKYSLIGAAGFQFAAALTLLFQLRMGWADADASQFQVVSAIGVWLVMVWGAWGLGYLLAAKDPYKHWGLIATGLLVKLLGPLAILVGWLSDQNYLVWSIVVLINDVAWIPVFAAILWMALHHSFERWDQQQAGAFSGNPLETIRSRNGRTLEELSQQQKLLVVFLRHLGCTFCRETVSDLAQQRTTLESQGVKLAFVHMSDPGRAREIFSRYGMEDVEQFSDPERQLYRYFDLKQGKLTQLLGPSIWWRGFLSAIVHRHGFSKIEGNGFQLPGVFLLLDGKILSAYRHPTAASRPDYQEIACSVLCDASQNPSTEPSTSSQAEVADPMQAFPGDSK